VQPPSVFLPQKSVYPIVGVATNLKIVILSDPKRSGGESKDLRLHFGHP
jgi:hypothetical protein